MKTVKIKTAFLEAKKDLAMHNLSDVTESKFRPPSGLLSDITPSTLLVATPGKGTEIGQQI